MDGFKMVGNTDYFDQSGTIAILIHTLIFVLVTMIIKIRLHRFLKKTILICLNTSVKITDASTIFLRAG